MAKNCPIVGECYFGENCEAGDNPSTDELFCDDLSLISDALGEEALKELVVPIYDAWNSAGCLRERIMSLRLLGMDQDVPNETRNLAVLVAEEMFQEHFSEENRF